MKFIWPLLILGLTQSHAFSDKIIYGADNRYEIKSFRAHKFSSEAKAVAGMVAREMLWTINNETFHFDFISLERMGIQGGEFSRQPVLPTCSGFLVAEDILVTAGHCVTSEDDCKKNVWVFDYTSENVGKRALNKDNIFSCDKIIKREQSSESLIDYAVIKLDRKTNRPTLNFRKDGNIEKDTPVVMIGHPMGLPMKFTADAIVWDQSDDEVFQVNLDAFQGNSGSPVFNEKTKEVEGILVRGSKDFSSNEDGLATYNICAENDPSEDCNYGEDVLKIKHVKLQELLKDI